VPTVGIITGYNAETRCVVHLAERPDDRFSSTPFKVVCAGASSDRAAILAEELIEQGCNRLISFGIAGALDPTLRPGQIIIPDEIIAPDGKRYPTSAPWRAALLAANSSNASTVGRAVGGALVGSITVATNPAAKRSLRAKSGAVAVDMESHAVAAVASRRNVPFIALRAIADTADTAIPQSAADAIGPDGKVRNLAVLGRLIRHPGDLPGLLRLQRDTAKAMASLRDVAGLLLLLQGSEF